MVVQEALAYRRTQATQVGPQMRPTSAERCPARVSDKRFVRLRRERSDAQAPAISLLGC